MGTVPAISYTPPNNTQQSSAVYKNDLDAGVAAAEIIAGMFAPHAIPPTPAAPTLNYTSGGSLAQTTYYVRVTYVTPGFESAPSPEVSLLVPANNVLTVASPATYGAVAGVTGWNVYVSTTAGTETLQNGSGTPLALGIAGAVWTEPTTGLVAGAALPTGLAAMSILVDAGAVFSANTVLAQGQQNTPTLVAPVTNPRIDRVVVNNQTGVISVIAGVENASPVPPAFTANAIPVAQILLQTTSTSITNSMITDERTAFQPSGGGGGAPNPNLLFFGLASGIA